MTLDTVFWIASMTKAVTSVAAMQLVEQGRLELDAPLGELLPGLASPQVLEGFDAAGVPAAPAGQAPDHAAPSADPYRGLRLPASGTPRSTATWGSRACRRPASGQLAALSAPLLFEPGERWNYGINTDWVGRAVEAASGQRLDRVFRRAHLRRRSA